MRSLQERITRFFEQPTREGLREILEFNTGEQNNLDFKESWPSYSKMAKHILAFTNCGGGCIVLGVSQNNDGLLESVGLESLIDKSEIVKCISPFVPSEVTYEIMDFSYESSEYAKIVGKKFQVLFIESNPEHLPFISTKNGDGIRENAIYIRKGTNSIEAPYEELQKVINRRIDTKYSSSSEMKLEEHLAQLKILYTNIERYHYKYKESSLGEMIGTFGNIGKLIFGEQEAVKNPNYPTEDYEQFINRMISMKKRKIERVVDQ